MRILVCGSRHFNDYNKLKEVLDDEYHYGRGISVVIHGDARGADRLAGQWGKEMGLHVQVYPADWKLHGRRAGPIRNAQMLREGHPEAVIAFRGPNSRGTQNMIEQARKAGIEVQIIDVP